MEEYIVTYISVDGSKGQVTREGTYESVESWAYQEMQDQEWECFGIEEA